MIHKLFLSLCTVLIAIVSVAQTTIKGEVKDAKSKKGIQGVSILIKGTTTGTTTDANGQFTITLNGPDDVLVFSHVGYHKHELKGEQALAFTSIMLKVNKKELKEVTVKEPFRWPTMKPIATYGANPTREFGNTSILETVNTVPGVRMEQRGLGGSRRISIRGSALRSPFGVRNIRMYWNGMAITSPDGSSPLEVIDMENMSSMEIIKGPVANMYGAWNGGAMLYSSRKTPFGKKRFSLTSTAGEYGLLRYTAAAGINKDKFRMDVAYVHQDYDGYRQQEFNGKDQLTFDFMWLPHDKHRLQLSGYLFDGTWGLPGAIDSASVAEDPTQAVQFAIDNDTRVDRRRARVGLNYSMAINSQLSLYHTFYMNWTDKENPYGTSPFFNGYKIENARGYGGRHEAAYSFNFPRRINNRVRMGFEYQSEDLDFLDHVNDLGQPGTPTAASNTVSKYTLYYFQSDSKIPQTKTTLTLGVNYNNNSYDHSDLYFADNIDFSGRRTFNPNILPRVGITQRLFNNQVVYFDWSNGYSSPALWEVSLPDGTFDSNIDAETSMVFELGTKLTFWNNKIHFNSSIYSMTINDAIVPQVDTTGMNFYVNSGQVAQKGWEMSTDYTIVSNSARRISLLKVRFSMALQDYKFEDYVKEGEDLSGNDVTGVPSSTITAGLNLGVKWGFYWNGSIIHVGKMPIRDDNEAYTDPYTVLHSRLGYRGTFGKNLRYELFGGVQNAFDEVYTSFVQLNGFGGRYFNPAAGRNFYGGLSLKFNFN